MKSLCRIGNPIQGSYFIIFNACPNFLFVVHKLCLELNVLSILDESKGFQLQTVPNMLWTWSESTGLGHKEGSQHWNFADRVVYLLISGLYSKTVVILFESCSFLRSKERLWSKIWFVGSKLNVVVRHFSVLLLSLIDHYVFLWRCYQLLCAIPLLV